MSGATTPCERCGGTGSRPLSPVEAATVKCLGAVWTTTSEIHRAPTLKRVKQTTLIMRLNRLHRLGLIERQFAPDNFKILEWRRA